MAGRGELTNMSDSIESLKYRHRVITDEIGMQDEDGFNLIRRDLPTKFRIQRRVLAVYNENQPQHGVHPILHDFRFTLKDKIFNVIDVSLDECLVPLVRNNVYDKHNDAIELDVGQIFVINSCVYSTAGGTLKITVSTIASRNIEEYSVAAASVQKSVTPAGSPHGVRITVNYDIAILIRGSVMFDRFIPGDALVLRWGRLVEEYSVAFKSAEMSADGQTVVGGFIYLMSRSGVSHTSVIGIAKRQSAFYAISAPIDIIIEHNTTGIVIHATDLVSVEMNRLSSPMFATSENGHPQIITRLSDYLIMVPAMLGRLHSVGAALPIIGSVLRRHADNQPVAVVIDIAHDRRGAIFIVRPCYIHSDTLSNESLHVDGVEWTSAVGPMHGVLGVTVEGCLPCIAEGECVNIYGTDYKCTGIGGVTFGFYVYARRGGNPPPIYMDTILDRHLEYLETEIVIPNVLNGHTLNCGSIGYTAITAKTIGTYHRSTHCRVTILKGFYTIVQYAVAVNRTINAIIKALDIGYTDNTPQFYIIFGTDGRAYTQVTGRQNSSLFAIRYRIGVDIPILGLQTHLLPMSVPVDSIVGHSNIPDPSGGVASRVVHIRIAELEGTLCPSGGPWRSFVVADGTTSLSHVSQQKDAAYAIALASHAHDATKLSLVELSTLTITFTTGDGQSLSFVPPGAVLLLSVSSMIASIDHDADVSYR